MHSSLGFHRRYNLFNLMFQRDRFHFALVLTGKKHTLAHTHFSLITLTLPALRERALVFKINI